MTRRRFVTALVCAAVLATPAARTRAYTTYARWSSDSAVFYVNPANLDVGATLAENAVKVGLNAWSTEAASPFRYAFGGRVNDTSTGYDGRNVIVFRNTTNGSALATTYSWWSGSSLVDADIVLWDGTSRFFTGTTGCASGAYLEDVLTHELGHALGLNHSGDPSATMYPSYSPCSTELRTLSGDDISGVQSLYGRTTSATTNTAPSVSITAPAITNVLTTSTIILTGAANDLQDGDLSGRIVWTSNLLSQPIGVGSSLVTVLTAGSHIVTATVTDSGGLKGAASVTVTVTAPLVTDPVPVATATPSLVATGYRVRKNLKVDLGWSGFSASRVELYRNGIRVTATANDGAWTDSVKKSGTYRYRACASGTTTCSNDALVTF